MLAPISLRSSPRSTRCSLGSGRSTGAVWRWPRKTARSVRRPPRQRCRGGFGVRCGGDCRRRRPTALRTCLRWSRHSSGRARARGAEAQAAAIRIDEPGRVSFALRAAASVHAGLGDLETSLEASAKAIEAARRRGEDSLTLADARVARAATLGAVGQLDDAQQELTDALETFVGRLGAEHPRVATARYNLGSVLFELGRYREALAEHEAALATMEMALAAGHPERADTLLAIAGDRMALGQTEAAIPIAERALQAYERAHGRAHHDTGRAALGLGLALVEAGRVEDGLAALRDADAIYAELYDEGDARRAEPLYALGSALASLERPDEAIPLVRRALAIGQAGLGPDHPIVVEMRSTLDALEPAETGR